MPLGEYAYTRYLGDQRLLRQVLEAAFGSPASDEIRRASTVLLCAAFEGFLKRLAEEHLDGMSGEWADLPAAHRMSIASTVLVETGSLQSRIRQVRNPDDAEAVSRTITRLAGWLSDTSSFAKAGTEPNLSGFWQPDAAPKVVERLLAQLRGGGDPFFAWVRTRGADGGSLWVNLEQVVKLRNDVAHGHRLHPTPTTHELRTYRVRMHIVAKLALSYCRSRPESAPTRETPAPEAGNGFGARPRG